MRERENYLSLTSVIPTEQRNATGTFNSSSEVSANDERARSKAEMLSAKWSEMECVSGSAMHRRRKWWMV